MCVSACKHHSKLAKIAASNVVCFTLITFFYGNTLIACCNRTGGATFQCIHTLPLVACFLCIIVCLYMVFFALLNLLLSFFFCNERIGIKCCVACIIAPALLVVGYKPQLMFNAHTELCIYVYAKKRKYKQTIKQIS